jgi:hypothetical protein
MDNTAQDQGRALGRMLAAQRPAPAAGVVEIKTSPAADLSMVYDAIARVVNGIKAQGARSKEIATSIHAAREVLTEIAQYMPESVDLSGVIEAIQGIDIPEAPDLGPALEMLSNSLDRSTAALERQNEIMLMDRNISYDNADRITKVSVAKK